LRRGGGKRLHAIVIGTGRDATALAVDRISGQREIVVRAMSDSLLKIEGLSGATELGDGRLVLILDAPALARAARPGSWTIAGSGRPARDAERRPSEEAPA
jgi:two-component system chemotaxis sensor kinase CheA